MNNNIKLILILGATLALAVYVGVGVATEQLETTMKMVGVLILIVCLLLGRRVWLLIPFLGSVQLTLMIPGTPSTLLLAQVLFIGFSMLLIAARRIFLKIRITELEIWMGLLTPMVFQAFARHPVGLSILGSSGVGGKPYFIYGLTLIAGLLFCFMRVTASELKLFLRVSIVGGLINFFVGIVGYFVPIVGAFTGTAIRRSEAGEIYSSSDDASRVGFLVHIAPNVALWVSSYISPLKACFRVFWLPLVAFSFVAAGASGFRNVVVTVGLTYLIALFYRGGLRSVILSCFLGVVALMGITVVNIAHPLPPNIQRSFSWLPGNWDDKYVLDADSSSDWRYEIWEEVLFTDRWIENKIFGDGLGFTAEELDMQQQLSLGMGGVGMSGFDLHRETILVNGDYHSGPVSAVRVVGYVGLIIMILMQLRLAIHAHRQIIRCRGTEWYPLSLFIGIPMLVFPIFFTFVFGGFAADSVALLTGCGLIRLLQNNLPLPAYRRGINNSNYRIQAVESPIEIAGNQV